MEKEPRLRLRWDLLSRQEFDRLVEALLTREHAAAETVWSPEDSGGDGGRDVLVEYPDRRIIYQLKFFPDGLTSKPDSRKSQIRQSFIAAAKHEPDEWILVFPSKINDTMRDYLAGLPELPRVLQKAPHGSSISTSYLDLAALDNLLVNHPEMMALVERDELVERARELAQETAVIEAVERDLPRRLGNIQVPLDSLDPDWTLDFAHVGGGAFYSLRAKHRNARPLSATLNVQIPETDSERAKEFASVLLDGGPGHVSLPRDWFEVTKLDVPEAFKFMFEFGDGLTLERDQAAHSALVGKTLRLVVTDPKTLLVLKDAEALIEYGGIGPRSSTVIATLDGGVKVELRVPLSIELEGTLTVKFDSNRLSPTQVRDSARTMLLVQGGAKLTVFIEGQQLCQGTLQEGADSDERNMYFAALGEAAEDLEVIQRATRMQFFMPTDSLSAENRIWLRIARIIFDGGVASVPRQQVTGYANAGTDPATWPDPTVGVAMLVGVEAGELEMFGRQIPLPPLWYYHPEVKFTGYAESAQDADAGSSEPRKFTVRSVDDSFISVYRSDGKLIRSDSVTPWALTGIREPKHAKLPGEATA